MPAGDSSMICLMDHLAARDVLFDHRGMTMPSIAASHWCVWIKQSSSDFSIWWLNRTPDAAAVYALCSAFRLHQRRERPLPKSAVFDEFASIFEQNSLVFSTAYYRRSLILQQFCV
jgi:hypothetical protein